MEYIQVHVAGYGLHIIYHQLVDEITYFGPCHRSAARPFSKLADLAGEVDCLVTDSKVAPTGVGDSLATALTLMCVAGIAAGVNCL